MEDEITHKWVNGHWELTYKGLTYSCDDTPQDIRETIQDLLDATQSII